MIRNIEGRLLETQPGAVVVSVHGIGYLIHTITSQRSFPVDEIVTFHTHLAVRENSLDLYGFTDPRELTYFELLLTVPKIGPKSALQVLSLADPDLIATAVLTNDADHLHKLSGIGKKTAANIVTALAGKIDELASNLSTSQSSSHTLLTSTQTDAIDALITLGYDEKEARSLIVKQDPTLPAKELIQSVLRQITL